MQKQVAEACWLASRCRREKNVAPPARTQRTDQQPLIQGRAQVSIVQQRWQCSLNVIHTYFESTSGIGMDELRPRIRPSPRQGYTVPWLGSQGEMASRSSKKPGRGLEIASRIQIHAQSTCLPKPASGDALSRPCAGRFQPGDPGSLSAPA